MAAAAMAVASAPSFAQTAACDPCPPDCPMMAPAPDREAPSSPADDGKAVSGCMQLVLCQAAPAVPAPQASAAAAPGADASAVAHPLRRELPARSRPPDRLLRPPIAPNLA